ncbi:site-specific integrase [Pseudomonas sp. ATCC 13867]|nr:site-specific integrase [Pseudomonas sp. ATCC 13867]
MFERLEHFLNAQEYPVRQIESAMLLSYRALLPKSRAWYFGTLGGLILKWRALGYEGIADDAASLIKSSRVAGNLKGEAVLTLDAKLGPLTDIESQAIASALEAALESGSVSEGDYLLAQLFMLLGQRAVQYAALKVRDLQLIKSADGMCAYLLRIPRAKQQNQSSREAFRDRLLIPRVGERLYRHCRRLQDRFGDQFPDAGDVPMFPTTNVRKQAPPAFRLHRTSDSLAKTLGRTLRKLNVISERTGARIHIAPLRFRRTLGTRAAIEGHGELVIAELLDHSDTQNVGVYTQAVPQIIERIDRAVAMHLAPLAQAFAGVLIEDESQASRKDDPTSRICDPYIDPTMRPMGSCGRHGFCDLLAPVACYTCRSFQPWRDGPHEAVLQYLLNERERFVGQSDVRIASINDRTILAVAEVVRLCAERQADESVTNG